MKGLDEPVLSPEVPTVSAGDEPDANRMHTAFAVVAQLVDGEVESLRRSLAELEKTLNRTIDGEKEARTNAVDGAKRELSSRIDEVVSAQDKSVNELKQSAEQERERVAGRLDEMKNAIEKSVNKKVEKLSGELDTLGRNLGALQLELQRQMETSERVTALLNNMAGVFTVNHALANSASGTAAAQPDTTASDSGAESNDPMEVDDALERMFK